MLPKRNSTGSANQRPQPDLQPPNVDSPDEASLEFQQANHDAMVNRVGPKKWVKHWLDHFDKQAQGLGIERLDG